jgi:hypothetical protein
MTTQGFLQVRCWGNATLFEARLTGSGGSCQTVSADVIKVWQSLAQASLLSGKTVQIDYQVASCNGRMTYMKLQ